MKVIIFFMFIALTPFFARAQKVSPALEFHAININGKNVLENCPCDEETGSASDAKAIKKILAIVNGEISSESLNDISEESGSN